MYGKKILLQNTPIAQTQWLLKEKSEILGQSKKKMNRLCAPALKRGSLINYMKKIKDRIRIIFDRIPSKRKTRTSMCLEIVSSAKIGNDLQAQPLWTRRMSPGNGPNFEKCGWRRNRTKIMKIRIQVLLLLFWGVTEATTTTIHHEKGKSKG